MNVTNTEKQQRRAISFRDIEIDFTPAIDALRDLVDWVLDIAEDLNWDNDEALGAIDRVREFLEARFDGTYGELRTTDLFRTVELLFAAFEFDDETFVLLEPLKASMPAVLRLPGAAHDEKPKKFPACGASAA